MTLPEKVNLTTGTGYVAYNIYQTQFIADCVLVGNSRNVLGRRAVFLGMLLGMRIYIEGFD